MQRTLPPRKNSVLRTGYDYTRGIYFVSMNVKYRRRLLSTIKGGQVFLTPLGSIVYQCWLELPQRFDYVRIDAFVVMPDHVHALLELMPGNTSSCAHTARPANGPAKHTLGAVMGQLKSTSTRRIAEKYGQLPYPLWQRRYFERLLRDQRAVNAVRAYIANNPAAYK